MSYHMRFLKHLFFGFVPRVFWILFLLHSTPKLKRLQDTRDKLLGQSRYI